MANENVTKQQYAMKLSASWDLEKISSSVVPRVCCLKLNRIILHSLISESDISVIMLAVKMGSSSRHVLRTPEVTVTQSVNPPLSGAPSSSHTPCHVVSLASTVQSLATTANTIVTTASTYTMTADRLMSTGGIVAPSSSVLGNGVNTQGITMTTIVAANSAGIAGRAGGGNQTVFEVDTNFEFVIQYAHMLKQDSNKLWILVQRRNKYKNKAIPGYKTLASCHINMAKVMQHSYQDQVIELNNITKSSSHSTASSDSVVVGCIQIRHLSSMPVEAPLHHQSFRSFGAKDGGKKTSSGVVIQSGVAGVALTSGHSGQVVHAGGVMISDNEDSDPADLSDRLDCGDLSDCDMANDIIGIEMVVDGSRGTHLDSRREGRHEDRQSRLSDVMIGERFRRHRRGSTGFDVTGGKSMGERGRIIKKKLLNFVKKFKTSDDEDDNDDEVCEGIEKVGNRHELKKLWTEIENLEGVSDFDDESDPGACDDNMFDTQSLESTPKPQLQPFFVPTATNTFYEHSSVVQPSISKTSPNKAEEGVNARITTSPVVSASRPASMAAKIKSQCLEPDSTPDSDDSSEMKYAGLTRQKPGSGKSDKSPGAYVTALSGRVTSDMKGDKRKWSATVITPVVTTAISNVPNSQPCVGTTASSNIVNKDKETAFQVQSDTQAAVQNLLNNISQMPDYVVLVNIPDRVINQVRTVSSYHFGFGYNL